MNNEEQNGDLVRLTEVGFAYPNSEDPALDGVNLAIGPGEALAVVGPTGGGKSTLLKVLAGLLPSSPLGRLSGQRVFAPAARCGVVFQCPDEQIVSSRVFDEVAFGLRNQGLPEEQIAPRVLAALDETGLGNLADADPETLSGGQKQRLVIAAAIALRPQFLVLDEPLAQLDPRGARDVMSVLERLRAQHGTTLCVAEHRLGECLGGASRVVAVLDGRVELDGASASLDSINALCEMGLRMPLAIEIARRIPGAWLSGVRDEEGLRNWVAQNRDVRADACRTRPFTPASTAAAGEPVLAAEQVDFRYTRKGFGLEGLNLTVRRGERVALLGSNGSGKSTVLGLLAGRYRPQSGAVRKAGRCGMTFQNPDAMLLASTALQEVAFGAHHAARRSRREADVRARNVLGMVGLAERTQEAPLALSRGQRLRLAVASILSMELDVLLLDEPTTGQDQRHMESLLTTLGLTCKTIVFSTHDVDLALEWADRAVVMGNGQVLRDGPPHEVLDDAALIEKAGLRRPAVLRICAQLGLPPCRGIDDLLEQVGPS